FSSVLLTSSPACVSSDARQAGPVLQVAEEPVDDRRRVPRGRLAREGDGERSRIAPAVMRPMAAGAGNRARRRPALVPEELLAERDLLGGDGIVDQRCHTCSRVTAELTRVVQREQG